MQLILALYRCGRQAEALEAYRAARGLLVDELGIEPGRKLRELQQAILTQDPALEVQAAAVEEPEPELAVGRPVRAPELAPARALTTPDLYDPARSALVGPLRGKATAREAFLDFVRNHPAWKP